MKEYSVIDGEKTIIGFKEVVEYITAKDKKTATLLGGSAADKEVVISFI